MAEYFLGEKRGELAVHKLYDRSITIKFDGRAHAYTWEEKGLFVPGVTKILSRSAKEGLLPWASNTAADYVYNSLVANSTIGAVKDTDDITVNIGELKRICKEAKGAYRRVSKEAADIGKKVHKFAEQWLSGEQPGIPPEADERIALGCEAFLRWLREHDVRPLIPEKVCFSKRWLYAGTCDFWGYIDGELTVGDFKTSKAVYIDHLLQTAAYQVAIEEELGVTVPARQLIRLDKTTGEFHVERHPHSNLHIDTFLSLRAYHEGLSKVELARKNSGVSYD